MEPQQKAQKKQALYQQIGQQIKAARLAQRMSQQTLAGRMFVPRTEVIDMENGRSFYLLDRLYAVSAALNISIHQLIPEVIK